MQPIKTNSTNKILGSPNGWDEIQHGPCVGLPVCETEDPYIYSWWKPSFKDRLKLLFGSYIRLCVVGSSHPPVAIDTEFK